MDRTALYSGLLDSYKQEIDSEEVGNYTSLKYKLMHIDSMLQLVNDIIISDRDLDPRYWAGLEQRSRKLRDIITGKLEDLEN